MRGLSVIGLLLGCLSGCAPGPYWTGTPQQIAPPLAVYHENPMLVPIADSRQAWETVVDVVDDYFPIEREEPVRLVGNTTTEGRLDTFPTGGATLLEPWRLDSVGPGARLESTLQSIRRRATVRVVAAPGGHLVDVAVFKELEDVRQPEHATAGAATLRYDGSLTRVVDPVGAQEINAGWIPQGRDTALEQRILAHLLARSAQATQPGLPPIVRGSDP